MNKNILIIAVCLILSVVFITGGIYALIQRHELQEQNEAKLLQMQQEKEQINADTDGVKKEAADLEQENLELQNTVTMLEQDCADLDKKAEELQQEYDRLCQDETNIYYLTILKALTEGMNQVEAYINDAQ